MFLVLQSLILPVTLLLVSAMSLGCVRRSVSIENSVTFPLRTNLKGLDPIQTSDVTSNEVAGNIFEGLLEYHYLKRPLEVQPLLAESLPTVSSDQLTHTFKLKKGIRFHDSIVFESGQGRGVTAADFVYSFKRLVDPRGPSEGFWIFAGRIKGLDKWRTNLLNNSGKFEDPIEGFEAKDDRTLIIRLSRPFAQLHHVLTMPFAAVVAKEVIEHFGKEALNHPIGTGPYRLKQWTRGHKVVLEKNPNWHGGVYPTDGEKSDADEGFLHDAGMPLPFVDELVFFEMPEEQTRWLNWLKGHVDFTEIPKDSFDGVVENRKLRPQFVQKGMRLRISPRPDIVYIGFYMKDPILGKNVHLRRALGHAIDRRISAERFYNNRVVAAASLITPMLDEYEENLINPHTTFDVELAKKELTLAGFPGGRGLPPLELSIPSTTVGRQQAEFLREQWGNIGVQLKVVSHSWPQFAQRLRQQKAQLWQVEWNADYPDSENLLQLLYGPNGSPGGNHSNYSNPKYDRLFEEAGKLQPGPARSKLYRQMRDIFIEDLPWIPLFHRTSYAVSHGWLMNFKRNETIKGSYKYLRVDLDKKRTLKGRL